MGTTPFQINETERNGLWILTITNGGGDVIKVFTYGPKQPLKMSRLRGDAVARPRQYGPVLVEREPLGEHDRDLF